MMSNMQISYFTHLQRNLSEIYIALQSKDETTNLPLEALSSSTVYYNKCLTGQLFIAYSKAWQWIQPPSHPLYSLNKVLQSIITKQFDHAVHTVYDNRQRRIWSEMRRVDQIWKNSLQLKDFSQQRDRYKSYLQEELKGSVVTNHSIYLIEFDKRSINSFDPKQEKVYRHTLVNFHQATQVFWSLFIEDEEDNEMMRKPLIHLLESSSTLGDHALFNALKKEGDWVQMEGIMQQSLPVALFAKLDGSHPLTAAENRHLKKWVQVLEQCQQIISPRLFSNVLHEIMNVIHLQGSSKLTLFDFLNWLNQQGCQLFFQEDAVHMDWRERLHPGDSIECNGKELVLGNQLSPQKMMHDKFKIFELENYPDYVVKIANNPLLLLLEERKKENEKDHYGVRLVEAINDLEEDDDEVVVSGLDSRGRCVVLEKLFSPVSHNEWSSQQLLLSQEDERKALVFANHFYCMAQWKLMPQHLSCSHLMWDSKGILKSTRLLKKEVFNYNTLESYCEDIGKGNPFVLSFLMHVSQLYQHPVANYYRDAVEHVLKTGTTDFIGRSLPLGYRQDVYNQHVKMLCERALELRENCFGILVSYLRNRNKYSHKQESTFKQIVADKLLDFYKASSTPGKFIPDLEEKFLEMYKTDSRSIPLPISANIEDYYRNQFKLMMKYNKDC